VASTASTTADRCPDISGKYANTGDSVSPQHSLSLASVLISFGVPWDKSVDITELSFDDADTLRVGVITGSQVVKEATLSRKHGDFTCDEDGLTPRSSSGGRAGEGGIGYASQTISFTTADGGVLAGKVRNSAVGIAFLIPVVGTQTMWYSWKPAP